MHRQDRRSDAPQGEPPSGSPLTRDDVLRDYRIAYQSRQASLLGRKEVLTGKAKFGIFGDGKEVAQVAMARAFRRGDIRSGYYRDQTFMLALGALTLRQFFAQLYAHTDRDADPASAGRQMNAHFATRMLDERGRFRDQTEGFNCSADVSPTGSQMPRLVGLAYASRLYRELPELAGRTRFSSNGDEIAWGTIGNASCAEGMFWEAINAAGVLKAPMLLSIWDDGYGISVPNIHQITKSDLSQLLSGFQRNNGSSEGFELYRVRGWDYPALCETYLGAAEIVRRSHVPAILHVVEMTQPQGHSTSGSHERYKSRERLAWEEEHDCLRKMRHWMLEQGLASAEELAEIEAEDREYVREEQRLAWEAYRAPIDAEKATVVSLLGEVAEECPTPEVRTEIETLASTLKRKPAAFVRDLVTTAREALLAAKTEDLAPAGSRQRLARWTERQKSLLEEAYGTHLTSETEDSPLRAEPVAPVYADDAPRLNGFEILNRCFDAAFARCPELVAFGEDVGHLGDVNQGMLGLQEKYGELRVSDTGIRECTIAGQAIGMAMRGLRPIAEIQYLDYILYALQILSDDLATLRWRTAGGQKAPVILRTRGHRLEGIWHAGSPLGAILALLRGIHVCVPRDMTRAAGFYNTLLAGDDPGLVIEVLNGYRLKEPLPSNLAEIKLPLGVPEVIREGRDVTLVTYGAMCRLALEAAEQLARAGIETEVIDVQTLLPFDVEGRIAESLAETNRIVFADEDVPGGATAFMMQQVLEVQGGYWHLDSEPRTLTAKPHRPAYGSDGDYASKPNREDLFDAVYELMHEAAPRKYPVFWR
jgi:pyruvate/2-oxoglutarate/acetoin dehydrogenase E1 component/TPP-dependent pyruvate/acetoin dehydrogenase alpha subunit